MDEWNKKLRRSSFFYRSSLFLGIFGLFLVLVSFVPSFWFYIESSFGKGINRNSKQILETAERVANSLEYKDNREYQPRMDVSLPEKNMLVVPSIGVMTEINEAQRENYEDALRIGVWRTDDSGTPKQRTKPVILVAHRFGYLKWSNLYRRKNSFYNLPKLTEGDLVEIIWRQRKYEYTVFRAEAGTEIKDYGADLILYTCNDLSSDIRVFRYARLLEI